VKTTSSGLTDEICVLVQIETRLALQNLEAIAGGRGRSMVCSSGRAISRPRSGHLGDNNHPEVRAAIEDALKRICQGSQSAGNPYSH